MADQSTNSAWIIIINDEFSLQLPHDTLNPQYLYENLKYDPQNAFEIAVNLNIISIVNLLLSNQKVDSNRDNCKVLRRAAKYNQLEIVQLLLSDYVYR